MIIKFVKLRLHAVTPTRATDGSAGFDLYSATMSPVEILSGNRVSITTGLRLEIPLGYGGQVRSRSGLARHHGIVVLNSPGTIDSDYRGELRVILRNTDARHYTVQPGDRIAQLIIARVLRPRFVEVEELEDTERGHGGCGSTGV